MADQVGSAGRVLAVDLDPRWCRREGRAQLEVRELDLVADPVPPGPWDVIHERLVLHHIPERLEVLTRLTDALAPGGVILVEDFDTGEVRTVDRAGPDHELIVRVAQAFNRLLATRGAVNDFAANALRILRGQGLEGTGASGHVAIDHGGTGWATRAVGQCPSGARRTPRRGHLPRRPRSLPRSPGRPRHHRRLGRAGQRLGPPPGRSTSRVTRERKSSRRSWSWGVVIPRVAGPVRRRDERGRKGAT